ncbi:hypothetical protein BB561_003993 [Smittium simulii]|uniref:Cyclin N-terminal domain-containing protein n=1 Tax=Smittium simulii TaxID=133385 RepID=A0A2T9YIJ8_9FUNG|nr:hypothetical protein BB561_003993 [Smittium simulii]
MLNNDFLPLSSSNLSFLNSKRKAHFSSQAQPLKKFAVTLDNNISSNAAPLPVFSAQPEAHSSLESKPQLVSSKTFPQTIRPLSALMRPIALPHSKPSDTSSSYHTYVSTISRLICAISNDIFNNQFRLSKPRLLNLYKFVFETFKCSRLSIPVLELAAIYLLRAKAAFEKKKAAHSKLGVDRLQLLSLIATVNSPTPVILDPFQTKLIATLLSIVNSSTPKPVRFQSNPVQQQINPAQQQIYSVQQQQRRPAQQQQSRSAQQQLNPVQQQQRRPAQQQLNPVQQQLNPVQQQLNPVQQQLNPVQQQINPVQQQIYPVQQQQRSFSSVINYPCAQPPLHYVSSNSSTPDYSPVTPDDVQHTDKFFFLPGNSKAATVSPVNIDSVPKEFAQTVSNLFRLYSVYDSVRVNHVFDQVNFVDSSQKIIIAALMCASKFLLDKSYSNKAWNKITKYSSKVLGRIEIDFLDLLDHRLFVSNSEFTNFRQLFL